ncbi:MAG: hypothetical protein K0R51_2689 [Cytophagaceae bacterium]|jgi:hypothetical protein|nr:hypothetical protein [Cytophagaceae bacterium]
MLPKNCIFVRLCFLDHKNQMNHVCHSFDKNKRGDQLNLIALIHNLG